MYRCVRVCMYVCSRRNTGLRVALHSVQTAKMLQMVFRVASAGGGGRGKGGCFIISLSQADPIE